MMCLILFYVVVGAALILTFLFGSAVWGAVKIEDQHWEDRD